MAPEEAAESISEQDGERRRSRRARGSSSKAKKALAQLRHHRETGEKIEYEIEEQKNVYDIVDENEYSKIVTQRREDDWIVDDVGSGYADDGREIFDEDLEEEAANKGKGSSKAKKGAKNEESRGVKSAKISNLFVAKSKKKKEVDASVKEDDILEDILQTLQSSKSSDKPTIVDHGRTPKRSKVETKAPRRLQNSSFGGSQNREKKIHMPQSTAEKRRFIEDVEELDDGVQLEERPPIDQIPLSRSKDNSVYNKNKISDHAQDTTEIELCDDDDIQFNEDSIDLDINNMEVDKLQTNGVNEKREKQIVPEEECPSNYAAVLEETMDLKTEQEPRPEVKIDSSSLPVVEEDGEKVLKFFWLDAYEDRFKQPGIVFLFGKVWVDEAKSYTSCCCMVKNIERILYLLPRKTKLDKNDNDTGEQVGIKEVYEEFNEICNRHKIMSFKCKQREKLYAFEKEDVPKQAQYLEIRYSAEMPSLPSDISGRTFSVAFGTNTTSLETLLLEKKIKGPSWLNITKPSLPVQPISWCKMEVVISDSSHLSLPEKQGEVPPLTVLSLRLQTLRPQKGQSHEIIAIAGLVHDRVYLDKASPQSVFNYNFCFISKPSEHLLPYDFQTTLKKQNKKYQITASERSMLGLFLARLNMIDPDVIVGHDVCGYDFDVLLHRISATKVPHWSKLGRLKRQIMPKLSNSGHGNNRHFQGDRNIACGRLTADVKISAQELIRSKSYDMNELASVILNKERQEVIPEEKEIMLRTSKDLIRLLELTMMDAWFNLKMVYELNVLPLAYQITGICGNVMSRTLQGGRSERNEFLLLHAFTERNFICPDKTFGKKQEATVEEDKDEGRGKGRTGRKKPAYSGGLVLEPKKGFYDKFVLLLDFNSLYPSIIQEFNICFTTIDKGVNSTGKEGEELIPPIPDSNLDFGVLPTEIKKLVERRRLVKGMMKNAKKNSDQYIQYDIRQKALKLTANSMYGCLGFSHSRFFAKPLAALVTSKGREILMKTKNLAETLGLDVIYGDTDSIMINTNSNDFNDVQRIGNQVKSEVNKLYKMLEIDIDGIYKSMLLLKKKKYAAVAVQRLENGSVIENQEMKGLDIVRRDWCDLAKDAGEFVLGQILSCRARDVIVDNIHEYLLRVKEQVERGEFPMHKYEIRKALAKAPEDYPDAKALPHVTVAQRLLSQGRRVAVGDTVNYVICTDGSSLPASQRAYHPDECQRNTSLQIDMKYYLSNQVHPVVSRLCDPIEGTTSAAIADCLGLDPSQYKSSSAGEVHDNDTSLGLTTLMSNEDRFQDVERFQVVCPNSQCSMAQTEIDFQGSLGTNKGEWKCAKCQTAFNFTAIQNNLNLMIRRHLKQYYQGYLCCDDASCGARTRLVRISRSASSQFCYNCKRGHLKPMYSEGRLYNQLLYLKTLFQDVNPIGQEGTAQQIQKKLKSVLDRSGYSSVDLSQVFTF